MSEINLPGYRTIVPNEVFGKRAEPIINPIFGEIPLTQVLRIKRFKVPTQEEVINLIIETTKGIDVSSLGKNVPSEDEDSLAYFVRSLPVSEIEDIARGERDSIDHLIRHYPERDFQEGSTYFACFNGILPDVVLEATNGLVTKNGKEVYDDIMKAGGKKNWTLAIRLLEDGALPYRAEIEYLLDRGVRDSFVLYAEGEFGDYQNVVNQIRTFYNTLPSLKTISQVVPDSSSSLLEKKASLTAGTVARCLTGSDEAFEGLKGIIGKAIQGFGSMGGAKNPLEEGNLGPVNPLGSWKDNSDN